MQGDPRRPLETRRLILRAWRESDAASHRELWMERDPRVPARRRIDAQGHPTVEELARWARDTQDDAGLGLLVIQRAGSGEFIGYCGLVRERAHDDEPPELAFEILRRHWGQGFATEAAAAIIAEAKAVGVHRLLASVREWNAASLRVLSKVGFTPTGRVEPDAAHGDSLLLSLDL